MPAMPPPTAGGGALPPGSTHSVTPSSQSAAPAAPGDTGDGWIARGGKAIPSPPTFLPRARPNTTRMWLLQQEQWYSTTRTAGCWISGPSDSQHNVGHRDSLAGRSVPMPQPILGCCCHPASSQPPDLMSPALFPYPTGPPPPTPCLLPAPFLFQEGSNIALAHCRASPRAAVGEQTHGRP